MASALFSSFEGVPYPCFFLPRGQGLEMNAAAKDAPPPLCDEKAMTLLLRTVTQEATATSEAFALPLPTDALGLHNSLVVMPTEEGLLAVARKQKQAPVQAFSTQVREPLTNIFSVLPLLAGRLEDEDLYLPEDIQANCYRLLRLAGNMEGAVKAQQHGLSAQLLDLGSLVEALCRSTRDAGASDGIPITCRLPATPLQVKANRHLLSDAILNVLRNSLQFTRDGNAIDLRLSAVGGNAVLVVEDRGLGIKPEHLPHIFQPYYSADPYGDNAAQPPGLGLGLSLVREAMSRFGGSVAAESRFGEGTRITLCLPVDNTPADGLSSTPADYLADKYSSVYVQLCGYCRMPVL